MNWISNFVKPKINAIFSRKDTPENLWKKCESCGSMIFHRELLECMNVCNGCGHHMYISPRHRFTNLFDGGLFNELPFEQPISDPLQFKDTKKYNDRLKDARKKTGETEAMLVAEGKLGRLNTVVAAQDFKFMGGSME